MSIDIRAPERPRRRVDGTARPARPPHARGAARLAGPVLLLALAGCGTDMAPFGRRDGPVLPAESVTVRRILGTEAPEATAPTILSEPGNVWPAEEAPRATLANPDASLSRPLTPEASPAVERAARERGPAPPPPRLRSESNVPDVPPEVAPNPRNPPPARLRGSNAPPPPPLDPVAPPPERAPRDPAVSPPAPRVDGRVIPRPGGAPAVTSGGTESYQTFTVPGTGQSGIAIPGGSTTTLVGPDGTVQVVPNAR